MTFIITTKISKPYFRLIEHNVLKINKTIAKIITSVKQMTILAPTDFSKLSKVAVLYAAKLAIKQKAKLVLFHVVFAQASSRAMLVSPKLEKEMKNIALEEMDKLISELKIETKGKLNIEPKILFGFPVTYVLQAFLKKVKIDLIITGTQGATGLKKVLIGTNTAAIIESSAIPVIIIPRNSTFKGFKKIVYATDLENLDKELRIVSAFAKQYNAGIDVVHVLPEEASTSIVVKQIKEDLIQKMAYPKINFHIIQDDDVTGALDNFMIDRKADLLVMFTHKLGFFEKLFSRSVTRNLAFHSHIPMLTYNKSALNL